MGSATGSSSSSLHHFDARTSVDLNDKYQMVVTAMLPRIDRHTRRAVEVAWAEPLEPNTRMKDRPRPTPAPDGCNGRPRRWCPKPHRAPRPKGWAGTMRAKCANERPVCAHTYTQWLLHSATLATWPLRNLKAPAAALAHLSMDSTSTWSKSTRTYSGS